MATKGRDYSVKERRGRSPLLPRKVEIGQQTRSLINPPILERKHALTSTEARKIPIYDKHTVSSTLYALNTIKPPSVDNARLVPQSKVMALKSKFNEKKVASSYMNMNMNTTGSTKTKDVRKPDVVKEISHGKKQTRLLDALSSSKDDHNIVSQYEDDISNTDPIVNSDILTLENCDKQRMDREDDDHGGGVPLCEPSVPTCSQDNSTADECLHIEHTDDEINQQDPPDKPPDGSNDHQELDVEEERSKDVECHEEPNRKEVTEVPKEEERRHEDEVVAHRKKETAAYEYVIEEQRLNKVKALVGAFEILISLQCDALQNKYVANNTKLC